MKPSKNKEEKTWQDEIIQIPALPLLLLFVIKQQVNSVGCLL